MIHWDTIGTDVGLFVAAASSAYFSYKSHKEVKTKNGNTLGGYAEHNATNLADLRTNVESMTKDVKEIKDQGQENFRDLASHLTDAKMHGGRTPTRRKDD